MTKVQKNCLACGDLITVRLADHKRGWGKFCDKACAAAWKCGQRPRDVNEYHAKCQGGFGWAADKLKHFAKYPNGTPPKAPKVGAQVGRVVIKPIHHSPSKCRKCGVRTNERIICDECESREEAMDAHEEGWDGHKVWS